MPFGTLLGVEPAAAASPAVVQVPASIDATGLADASAPLVAFLDSVPDGSTIEFPAGGIYRMDAGLKFLDRHDLTFEGNGATLRSNGDVHEASSLFALWSDNTGIVIHDFNLVGNSPSPGVYLPGEEGAHGVLIDGGSNVDVSDVTISGVYGDAFYVGGWADGVNIHDSIVKSNGRNGVAVIAGRNVTVQRVTFDESGYCTLDVEANDSTEGAANVKFLDNLVGTWGDVFFAADGAAGSVVDGVTVSGNRVTGSSLATDVTLARRQDIVFTNNASTVAADGPVLKFAHVDGLTVSGNSQPLRSGSLAAIVDSTNVSYGQPEPAQASLPVPSSTRTTLLTIAVVLAVLVVVAGVVAGLVIRRRRRAAPTTRE
ncbi:MAG TPA: right-handed parallel beta-helix repeat-containing protein [Candidatus Limnocylindrales bacterium]